MQDLSLFPWRKIKGGDFYRAESFLRSRENLCVAAYARFLQTREGRGHVWYLEGQEGEIAALLIFQGQSLYPVFAGLKDIPSPRFLSRFLGKVHIHAIQGLKEDSELLENLTKIQGYHPAERINYDLMALDEGPRMEALKPSPAGLLIRRPEDRDRESLFRLQAAYEQEEVIPKNGVFDPFSSRKNFNRILTEGHVLLAELDGQVVGKINTSAFSFSRAQIGGVYIRPEYRGRGIAARMTAAFVRDLLAQGKGITLFVKKRNAPAKAVYLKLGFRVLGDYRIVYY